MKDYLLWYIVASWVIVLIGLLIKSELFRAAAKDLPAQFENDMQALRYVASTGVIPAIFVVVMVSIFVLVVSPFVIPVFIWRKVKKCMKS